MCGIGGWIDYKNDVPRQEKVMWDMSETLAPRGPDESGEWKSRECYFVHRRLTVIDRENGKQPMTRKNTGSEFTVCYNGELYNTSELRRSLKRLGYVFYGHSDTEVLLCSFMEWGVDCLEHLNGIFAFAVWDSARKRLFLARDRAGVKPLFYYEYDGGLIFGSEIKTLLAHPYIKPKLTREGVASVILLGPARHEDSGIFSGIKALKPAHYAVFGESGIHLREYWSLKAEEHTESLEETLEHIRILICDSIERQLVSDVPLCTFLSGGLDSSVISAVAARKYRFSGEKLTTFSVDYADNHANFVASSFQPDEDAPWIKRMSDYIGSNHRNMILDTSELSQALGGAVFARDCAGMADVDSSLLLFCKEVKEDFPVAVSGECADEIFGGYPWYRNITEQDANGFPWSDSTLQRAGLLKKGVIGDIDPLSYVAEARRETAAKTHFLDSDSDEDILMREMFMLNFHWFMQVLLERKDRMSMANGLEVRVPFCDHRIVQYAYNIPNSMKMYRNREKGLIREAMKGILPDDVLWRKKSPYPKTHNPAYKAAVISGVKEILSDKDARVTEILDRGKLVELVDSEGGSFDRNWYGQLMTAPQLFAYIIQLEHWLKGYDVEVL